MRTAVICRPAVVHRTARSMASSEISPSKARKARPGGKLWTPLGAKHVGLEANANLTVDFTTMTDLENPHLTAVIVDSVKETILANSDAPSFLEAATKHFDARRPRVFRKAANRLSILSTACLAASEGSLPPSNPQERGNSQLSGPFQALTNFCVGDEPLRGFFSPVKRCRIFKILDPPEQASVFTNAKKDALFAAAGRDDKL